ncbi:MAG: hypothetical protein RMJ19_14325 [Gemmatales bacterium]|nr:hypothetical protein [Gemmatales bacterium]MDW8176848.1 hypothetical protein [Gemmatales bacterium]
MIVVGDILRRPSFRQERRSKLCRGKIAVWRALWYPAHVSFSSRWLKGKPSATSFGQLTSARWAVRAEYYTASHVCPSHSRICPP